MSNKFPIFLEDVIVSPQFRAFPVRDKKILQVHFQCKHRRIFDIFTGEEAEDIPLGA